MSDQQSIDQVVRSLNGLIGKVKEKTVNNAVHFFNSLGRITTGPIKEWYGTTTSVNGVWTVDISSAGFKQIMHVDPQPIYNSNNFNNQVYPSVNTVSLTSVTGRVSTGSSGVFKSDALTMAPNCTVMVKVTGR